MEEPKILTAPVYFWTPGGNAASRRRNEERHYAAVSAWFESLGMLPVGSGWEYGDLRAEFSYSESCRNVYRRLRVTKSGRLSNITALRRLATPAGKAAATKRAAKAQAELARQIIHAAASA